MGRKERNKNSGFRGDQKAENQTDGTHGATFKPQKFGKDNMSTATDSSFVRTQLDPETAKYFTEIANVIEGTEIDLDERSVICGSALAEARGKEVELATDYIISHTMQVLLEGCSLENLCDFLRGARNEFSQIAMDRSGSHVAETALKSLATHLQDNESRSIIEETLTALCEAIVVNSADIMCNCHGSHVLRRLLCLCKGVSMETSDFHSNTPSFMLAERLNLGSSQLDKHESQQNQPFPDQLKFLISEMLYTSGVDIATVVVNQFGSLVLQTALKLLAGDDQELLHIIPILLGWRIDSDTGGNIIDVKAVKKVLRLVEENAFSHLMEVILDMSPDSLYDEILTKVFKSSLFKMSSHPCSNFVVQALISQARNHEHVKLIWDELGTHFKDLLEMGRSGVVAALLAASRKLQIYEQQCCQALADAVCVSDESSAPIVSRILFLDNYFYSVDKVNWKWPTNGARMHVLGSLILQSIFRFPNDFIQAYVTSIVSLEDHQVLEASKNPIGNRVIEAFLSSNASAKYKRKLVGKLEGHFGELSLHPSGSFTIDKFFDAGSSSLKEAIVSELLPIQTQLSKTKQGPFLLKKLDVEGYSRQPDQWRSRQTTKQSTYKEFYATFGTKEVKSEIFPSETRQKSQPKEIKSENFLSETRQKSQPENMKDLRNEIDTRLSTGTPFLANQGSAKTKGSADKSKRRKKENISSSSNDNKGEEILKSEKSTSKREKKRHKKDQL